MAPRPRQQTGKDHDEEKRHVHLSYDLEKDNSTRVWHIQVVCDGPCNDGPCNKGKGKGSCKVAIVRRYGVRGGKLTETTRYVTQGKNLGKSNETTPLQQAISEAESLARAQLDAGYIALPSSSVIDDDINDDGEGKKIGNTVQAKTMAAGPTEQVLFPMLAHEYSKHIATVTFPCILQPKLDGIRLIAGPGRASLKGPLSSKLQPLTLRTRTGKLLPAGSFGDLALQLAPHVPEGVYLDGEMYMHGHRFEEITSMFKHGDVGLQYCVYDLFDASKPHMSTTERFEQLAKIVNKVMNTHANSGLPPTTKGPSSTLGQHVPFATMARVNSRVGTSKGDVDDAHAAYVELGYEGVMIRSMKGPYEPGKRSKNLLKLKAFVTDEFEIIDVIEADGADVGTAIFVCRVPGRGHSADATTTSNNSTTTSNNSTTTSMTTSATTSSSTNINDADDMPNARSDDDIKKKMVIMTRSSTFNVRMKASREVRRAYLQQFRRDPTSIIGRMVTVRYQELTANGIPRFPVALALRDYE
jgi:DNA ligase 1